MLKKNPYLRHCVIFIIYLIMWPINFFIAPILFILGQTPKIIKYTQKGKITFWSWFVNIDEPTIKENMYGDEQYLANRGISDILSRNFFTRFYWYCVWCVFRNSYFYFKMYAIKPYDILPQVLKVKANTVFGPNATEAENLHLCNYHDRGKIHIIERRKDTRYFRYSFTKEIFSGKYIWNVQLGVNGIYDIWGNRSTNRYLFKSKFRKL